jgi:WD40 repeat protein
MPPRVRALVFAPDGLTLASCCGRGGRVWLWDLAKGKVRKKLAGHRWRLECLTFAPHGGRLASADNFGWVGLWDLAAGTPPTLFRAAPGLRGPHCLAFSPDGQTLATPALSNAPPRSRGVRCWDAATGQEGTFLNGAQSSVTRSLAYAPDGRTLASGYGNRVITLWDLEAGGVAVSLPQQAAATGLAFTPDGRTLAAISGWSVVLWDVPSRQERARLQGHKDLVWSLALSPDGRTLATASNDGTVKLWDVAGGRERAAFDWQIGKVYAVAFAPDGMRAAAGGRRSIVVWDVDEG